MKFALCTGANVQACSCDATGCSVSEGGNHTLFDAALEDAGDSLVGTLKIGFEPGNNLTVRLKRL